MLCSISHFLTHSLTHSLTFYLTPFLCFAFSFSFSLSLVQAKEETEYPLSFSTAALSATVLSAAALSVQSHRHIIGNFLFLSCSISLSLLFSLPRRYMLL
ncbi:hypothetical protein QL285_072750 [Trifolium repens]|nr:hypothetical protein QL285_072750 [Trifolium repens]